ncbi:hypothetical protein HDV05_004659 [Chytridiales sp. JEL 0842]|nr:hypothetical protein HDV05_004659 [Chytridiales sp. JEL 0842]
METFPPKFIKFLEDNGIRFDDYNSDAPLPRYIRLNPRSEKPVDVESIEKELATTLEPVEWLPGFYKLDAQVKIVNCSAYKRGVAVHALSVEPSDHVLDLCCAPGGKTCLIGDMQGDSDDVTGTVTGVDVSKHRLATSTRLIASDPQLIHPSLLYDKVLVDAECTHDGSIAHLKKCDRTGWERFEANFFDPVYMDNLEVLQRGLIENGFTLLKPGGVMVYSTCSFSKRQNEQIVQWLLRKYPNACLQRIPDRDKLPVGPGLAEFEEELKEVVRFTPAKSGTSGLFVARIGKR